MPYFVENADGTYSLVDKDFVMEELGDEVVAAYTIEKKISRTVGFKSESLITKAPRRFRCKDGQLRTKEEMSEDDKLFMKQKMAKTRAAKKGKAD